MLIWVSYYIYHAHSYYASTLAFSLHQHYIESAEAAALYEVFQDQKRFIDANVGSGRDWRVDFWPKASELSYSTKPAPSDRMWDFLAEKLHVTAIHAAACGDLDET